MACHSDTWNGTAEVVTYLEEAGRLLQQEEPGTRPAARAYDRVDAARRIDGCPTDTGKVLKAVARATRDVLVLRCCWLVDHRSRDAFLHELATAFGRPIKGELESQLLHAYNTLTSSSSGWRGGAQGAVDFVEDVAQRCGESVLGADMDRVDRISMEPMKVSVQG